MGVFAIQDLYVVLGIVIQTVLIFAVTGGPLTLLTGLRAYFPNNRATRSTPAETKPPSTDEHRSTTSGAARRRQRREADTSAGISAAEGLRTLLTYPLTIKFLNKLEGVRDYENLALLGQLGICSVLTSEALSHILGLPRSSLAVLMPVGAVLSVPLFLFKAELLSNSIGRNDKVILIVLTVLSMLLSTGLAFYVSEDTIPLGMQQGAAALSRGLSDFIQQRLQHPVYVAIPLRGFKLSCILFTGVVCALLFGPAIRVARCIKLGLYPPKWGEDYVAAGFLYQLGMLIQYLLPLSTALLFITPLVTYVAIPSPLLSWARAGSLFSCSILQVLLFRGYIQTYLSSAMVMWYRVGQSTFATTQPEQAAQFVVGKMEAQLVLLPKVAVQMLGLGVLWGCCGLLLGLQCLLGFEKTQGGATSHAVYTALPALVAGAQFVGVMTTSLHWVYTTLCLVLLQTGYMQT